MGPLSFVRVIDLTDLRGALCARILADLGAEVIRVEHAGAPATDRTATAYRYRNANKRGTVLDLTAPAGIAELDRLAADADIVVDNGSRDLPDGSITELRARHPHLVHVALRDFGLTGPRAGWRLEPLTALAASGTMFATGFPTMAPCGVPGHLAHDCASVYGAVGAVAALADRARGNAGQCVEVSVQEAALAGTTPWSLALRDYLRVNPHLPAKGTRNADGSYWVLPAADGWVRTVIGSPRQWDGFVSALGSPEALLDDEWSKPVFRLMNADVVRIVAQECLVDRTRAELLDQAKGTGATIGVLHTPLEFVAHEQTKGRGFFASTGFPGLGDAPFATAPYHLDATPTSLRSPAPDGTAGTDLRWAEPTASRHLPTWSSSPTGLLLEGVRVVEFGMAAVVPELTGVLSELGAEVIKIESVTHPDVLRTASGQHLNRAFTFNAESRGRESVAIDISTDEGRALALRLCASADIVAENYRGGVLDRAGLGYADVRAVNPTVIYAASQGYGRGGPYGEMPAYGPLNNGFAGLHHLWSDRTTPYPCGTSLNHPDHIAGKLFAVAVLAALVHRARTGEGQLLDMAQTEAAAYLMGEVYLDAARTGDERPECGNESSTMAPHGVYRTAGDDRWLALAITDDHAWQRFCDVAALAPDPALDGTAGRLAARERVDELVQAWAATQDADEAAERLQASGVSAMPVMGPDDHHADAHLRERAFIVELHHPEVGIEHHVGNPLRFSRLPQRVAASAPCLGADTTAVLERVLGIDATTVDDLAARGICR